MASDDHQPEVGLEQVVLGPAAVLGDPLQVDALVRVHPLGLGELLLGEQAGLDPLGELDLLLGVEQRDLADLLQVVLDRVGGRARDGYLRGRQVIVVVTEDEDLVVAALAGGLALGEGAASSPAAPSTAAGDGRVVGILVAVRGFGQVSRVGPRQVDVGVGRVGDLEVFHAERVLKLVVKVDLEVLEVDRLVEVGVRVEVIRDRQVTGQILGRHRRELLARLGRARGRAGTRILRCALGHGRLGHAVGCLVGHPRVPRRGAGRPGALARRGVGSAHHHGHLFLRWVAWLSCVRTLIGPSREGLDAWTVPGSRLPVRLGDVNINPPASSPPP